MDSNERIMLEAQVGPLERRQAEIQRRLDAVQRERFEVEDQLRDIRQRLRADERERNRIGPLPDHVHVADLELAVRTENCLLRVGITTVGQLCASTERELLVNVPGFSRKQLDDVREALEMRSMSLRAP
jgi:DNA-directed RNA polymerase alpha subunit